MSWKKKTADKDKGVIRKLKQLTVSKRSRLQCCFCLVLLSTSPVTKWTRSCPYRRSERHAPWRRAAKKKRKKKKTASEIDKLAQFLTWRWSYVLGCDNLFELLAADLLLVAHGFDEELLEPLQRGLVEAGAGSGIKIIACFYLMFD